MDPELAHLQSTHDKIFGSATVDVPNPRGESTVTTDQLNAFLRYLTKILTPSFIRVKFLNPILVWVYFNDI